jgi:hypothetical protein
VDGRPVPTGGHLETQHADDLPVFGHYPHLPVAHRVAGEVLLVGPGTVTLLASAMDIQGNTVHLLAVEFPDVEDSLVQSARRVDGGIGEQPAIADLAGADFLQRFARRAVLVVEPGGDSVFGHP